MENPTNNPAGTKPEAARDGLAEAIQKIEAARVRLYALADDALDDCQAGEEVESVAHLLSYAQEAIEKAKGDAPRNNTGREWIAVRDLAGDYLEVWNTDESGKRVKRIASCFVTPGESYADAVAACLVELSDPDTCFDSEEEEADTRDGIKWLAEALNQEGGSK